MPVRPSATGSWNYLQTLRTCPREERVRTHRGDALPTEPCQNPGRPGRRQFSSRSWLLLVQTGLPGFITAADIQPGQAFQIALSAVRARGVRSGEVLDRVV